VFTNGFITRVSESQHRPKENGIARRAQSPWPEEKVENKNDLHFMFLVVAKIEDRWIKTKLRLPYCHSWLM